MGNDTTAPLAGRTVLVTGASSGIGRAIAIAAARAGADVALTYCANAAGAHKTEAEIQACGRRAVVMRLDLAREPSVREVATQAYDALGRIDAWVNNAGADILTNDGPSLSTMEKLDRLIAVDLRGTMIASWQAATRMAQQDGGGVIVNMSWDHVICGMSGLNPQLFSAVKGGVLSFSKSLARSVGPRVRVNILAPGWIETAFGKDASEALRRRVVESTPLRRWGCPEDVAAAAVFLASPSAAFITGQTIMVNGGVVM
jgi:3-oxoacyl-[acyl-carrier protein] reductase